MRRGDAPGERRHFARGLLERDRGLEPRDYAEEDRAARGLGRVQAQRTPDRRRGEHRGAEAGGHYADDLVRFAAERHGPPNHRGVGSEAPLPQRMAQDGHGGAFGTPSSAVKPRPSAGLSPMTCRYSGVTCSPTSGSGASPDGVSVAPHPLTAVTA